MYVFVNPNCRSGITRICYFPATSLLKCFPILTGFGKHPEYILEAFCISPKPKREGNKLQQSSIPFATTMTTLRTGICNIQPAMVYNGDSALMGLSFWRKHRVLFKASRETLVSVGVEGFCDISLGSISVTLSSYAGF